MRGHRAVAAWVMLALVVLGPRPVSAEEEPEPLAHGLSLYAAGRYAEAERAFARAARGEPELADAHYWLGLAASRAGHHGRAVQALERARELDPDLPGVDLQLGIALRRGGEDRRAAEALDRALAADPDDAAAHYFRGLVAQALGDHALAESHLRRAAELDPQLAAGAWLGIGRSRAQAGDREAALEALGRARSLEPEGATATAARALAERIEAGTFPERRWSVTGSVGFEADDNLTVSELDVTTGQSDVAGVFAFGASGRPWERGASRLELGYDFYQSLYSEVTELDLQSHTVSAGAGTALAGLDAGLDYYFLHATLGAEDFLDLQHVAFTLGRGLAPRWYVSGGYHFEDRRIADDERRDGTRLGFTLDQFLLLGEHGAAARLGWRIEIQDARGAEFDYVGNTLTLGLQGDLPWRVLRTEGRLGWEFEARDYSSVTPSIGERRHDRRNTLRLQLVRPILRHLAGVLEYQYIGSSSNLPSQDYDENIVTLRLQASF